MAQVRGMANMVGKIFKLEISHLDLGRVFSTIFTLVILLMPVGTLTMPLLPYSVALSSFLYLGLGIARFALLSLLYSKKYLSKV